MKKTFSVLIVAIITILFSGCSLTNQAQRQIDRFSGSPEVSSISPQNGASDVALDAQIEVTFSQEMDSQTLNAKGVVISYADENLVVFLNPFLNSEYAYDEAAKKLIITPSQKFIPGQEVRVVLTDKVRNKDGLQLPTGTDAEGDERYIFSFTTQKVAGEQAAQESEEEVTAESVQNADFDAVDAENAVRDFMVTKSGTFKFDGRAETLSIDKITPVGCAGCFDVVTTFVSKNEGYGDRSGQGISSGETLHEGFIRIEGGEIIQAILDEKWDMLEQKDL